MKPRRSQNSAVISRAMTFELLLCPGCDDQISDLRRQETSQLTHALDFAYLLGDALFEFLIELGEFLRLHLQLVSSLAQFVEQPRVLDGNDCLVGEVRE